MSKAYAKINLSLDIVRKMDDGYHSLRTIMQTVALCDEITIELRGAVGRITIDSGLPYTPNDDRNVAVKAARAYMKRTGGRAVKTGIHIKIDKKIPVCAGLGGGSADAACVLRMLDEMHQTALERKTLEKLGSMIGADVPFCVTGGTKLAEGRGVLLTDLPPMPPCHIVICKPPFSCSTPELFACVDVKKIRTRPDTDGIISSIRAGDLGSIARRMYNVFEDVIENGFDKKTRRNAKKDITDIKSIMLDHGALGAVMTGSGPSVFGIFDDQIYAAAARKTLKSQYEDVFLTETKS